jgi:hypothetical protein
LAEAILKAVGSRPRGLRSARGRIGAAGPVRGGTLPSAHARRPLRRLRFAGRQVLPWGGADEELLLIARLGPSKRLACPNSIARTPAYPEAGLQGYNLHALTSVGRTYLIALAVLVAAFVTLYPLLDCGPGECPEASQASHAAHSGLSTTCLIAVLVASLTALAWASLFGGRRAADDPRPPQTYLSPDPLPPRVSPSL